MNPSEIIADKLLPFMNQKVEQMRQRLIDNGVSEGSNLVQSIAPDIRIYPDRVEGVISLATDENGQPYHQWLDEGVDGTEQPQGSPFSFKNNKVGIDMEKSLATWIKAKYGEGKGFDSKRGQWYGLGVNVKKRGIKRTQFISGIVGDKLLGELGQQISKDFGVKILDSIVKIK
jgi:hypothetical protein